MTVLKASRLRSALEKARNAGQVEEAATIAGLSLVFSSLPAEAQSAILDEMEDVPATSYAVHYQVEHVCRSIVEVDGADLRGVEHIEVEASEQGGPPVKVERHQWLRDNMVSTWSWDVVQVAFHKVMDAMAAASERANEGVQFRVETETDEEKFRRILGELKEAGAELPDDMRQAILKEEGLSATASTSELQELEARARSWSATSAAPVDEPPPAAPAEDEPEIPEEVAAYEAPRPAEPPTRAPQSLVNAARIPLNQTPIRDPMPAANPEQSVVAANRRSGAPPPDQVYDMTTRAERFASIEALQGDHDGTIKAEPKVDQEGARSIVDKPPVVGVNARYVNPHTRGLNPRAAAGKR